VLNFKIAVAQIAAEKGDVNANIMTHLRAIEKASQLGVSYLVFPELSLTGYEPQLAKMLAFSPNDTRLKPLIESAIKHNIQLGVGAPLESNGLPHIGLIIISPSGDIDTYEKIHLHPGEEKYFSKGNNHHVMSLSNTKIANAICADANHLDHVRTCSKLGASIYIAGVLISETGYQADTAAMSQYARKYNLLVAMANHNKPTGGWTPFGQSALWSNKGLLARANQHQNAILVAEKINDDWSGQVFDL